MEKVESGFLPSQISREKSNDAVSVCSELQVQGDSAGERANFNLIQKLGKYLVNMYYLGFKFYLFYIQNYISFRCTLRSSDICILYNVVISLIVVTCVRVPIYHPSGSPHLATI